MKIINENHAPKTDYLNTIYSSKRSPKTTYPHQLTRYLFETFQMKKGQTLLEVGCGRGDFLDGFSKLGLNCMGVDLQPEVAPKHYPHLKAEKCDIESERLPFADNSIDIIYSKSVLEHLNKPDKYLVEAFRVLKKGGLILTLVPDWESNYKIYFDDFTHRTPFTKISLHDILTMSGFTNTQVKLFRQLPVVWKYPVLNIVCKLISPFVPVRSQTKFLRWSRELMLLGSAVK